MRSGKNKKLFSSLTGQCLIATPQVGDAFFKDSLIFVCDHSQEGTVGFMINQSIHDVSFSDLLDQFNLKPSSSSPFIHILSGGPVETTRGFILHSAEYLRDHTVMINQIAGITSTVDILRDISEGYGPEKSFLALGYASWAPGQLEEEIKENAWLSIPADPQLLFQTSLAEKRKYAMKKLGIDFSALSPVSGKA